MTARTLAAKRGEKAFMASSLTPQDVTPLDSAGCSAYDGEMRHIITPRSIVVFRPRGGSVLPQNSLSSSLAV